MKIAIFCVNYNSYDSLHQYLASIDKALEATQSPIELKVIVADNTSPALPVRYTPRHFTLNVLITGGNKGYFGAVRIAMQQVSPADFDYAIISNVDVLISIGFFTQLLESKLDTTTVGWIAPEIYSQSLGFDFNPQAIEPYSLKKLKALRLMFKYPWLLRVKQKLLYKYHDIKDVPSGPIYVGHGSFLILTKSFFIHCGIINYPIFLYGEEIYLAETCKRHHLQVVYEPAIKVIDIGRVSTGKILFRQYCKYNYKAIDYIIKTFYENDSHT